MLKLFSIILVLTSCQSLGIKDTDTIQQVEIKVVDALEEKVQIHHEAEPPMITAPAVSR